MYVVLSRRHLNGGEWREESRHRLFERAQEAARRLTSAKVAIRNRTIMYHRDDVTIWLEEKHGRGSALYSLGPQSFDY